MPMNIISASNEERTITGRIVTWNEEGATSAGLTSFSQNSIKAKNVKLLLEHDRTRPIGKVLSMTETPQGIDATFKIAQTTAGNDALIEAATGLRDGFSVGVMVDAWDDTDGVMVVSKGSLAEVSLVTDPAIASAVVTDVAASEQEISESNQESDATPTKGDEVETSTVPETSAAETVEVASPVQASRPVFFTAPRSPIRTNAQYLEHTIKAKLNPQSESALWVAAADDAKAKFMLTAADDSFSTNVFNPVQYMSNVVQVNIGARPVIDACGGTRAIPSSGMTISIPKITTNGTVATTAEGGAPSETGIVSSYVSGSVVKLAGLQRWSVELQERSDPSFMQIMLDNMTRSYRKATEVATIAAITAGGVQAATTAASAAGIQSFVSTESAAAYLATGDVVAAYTAGVSQWSLMQNAVDGSQRPLFSAGQPQNSSGSAQATTLFGNVLGIPLYVSSNMVSTSIDESAFLIVPSAIELFESSQLMLSTNVPVSGEIEAMIYGYFCPIVTIAGGLRRFNLT